MLQSRPTDGFVPRSLISTLTNHSCCDLTAPALAFFCLIAWSPLSFLWWQKKNDPSIPFLLTSLQRTIRLLRAASIKHRWKKRQAQHKRGVVTNTQTAITDTLGRHGVFQNVSRSTLLREWNHSLHMRRWQERKNRIRRIYLSTGLTSKSHRANNPWVSLGSKHKTRMFKSKKSLHSNHHFLSVSLVNCVRNIKMAQRTFSPLGADPGDMPGSPFLPWWKTTRRGLYVSECGDFNLQSNMTKCKMSIFFSIMQNLKGP